MQVGLYNGHKTVVAVVVVIPQKYGVTEIRFWYYFTRVVEDKELLSSHTMQRRGRHAGCCTSYRMCFAL